MVVDGHHPAVVDVELGPEAMDRGAATADVGHPLELRLAVIPASSPVLLDVEIEAGGDIGDQRGFPADEDGEGDQADADEGRVDVEDVADGRADPGQLLVPAIERVTVRHIPFSFRFSSWPPARL